MANREKPTKPKTKTTKLKSEMPAPFEVECDANPSGSRSPNQAGTEVPITENILKVLPCEEHPRRKTNCEDVVEVQPCAFSEPTQTDQNDQIIEVLPCPDQYAFLCTNPYLVFDPPTVTAESNDNQETNESIPEIQPLAYNNEIKKKIFLSCAQSMFLICIMFFGISLRSISNERIIENPWLFIPKYFTSSFVSAIIIPCLYLYRSKNLRHHIMKLIYNCFPCASTDNIVDVVE